MADLPAPQSVREAIMTRMPRGVWMSSYQAWTHIGYYAPRSINYRLREIAKDGQAKARKAKYGVDQFVYEWLLLTEAT